MLKYNEKLDAEAEKQDATLAIDVTSKSDVLMKELMNAGLSACADVKLVDVRNDADMAIVALATKTEKETVASKAAKKRLDAKDLKNADEEVLVNQSFKVTKELATLLKDGAVANSLFFMDGKHETTK